MMEEPISGIGELSHQRQTTSSIRWGNPSVRNPMSRSRLTVRGLTNDPKGFRYIATESEIERRFALCALHWSAVYLVLEQHLELIVKGENGFSLFPDFCLTLTSGQKLIVEIKAAEKLAADEELRTRLTIAAHEFQKHGLLFSVVTERDFNSAYHKSNLQQLKPFLNFPTDRLISAIESISKNKPTNFGQLVSIAGNSHIALALIAQKYLSANLQFPLSIETPINCEGELHEPDYFQGWHPTDNPWQEMEDC